MAASAFDPIVSTVDALIPVYKGRRWLLAIDVLQGANAAVERLNAWGAAGCLVLAARRGTGADPKAPFHVLDLPTAPMMEALHAAENSLRRLPDPIQAAVDQFDPERRARVLGAIFSDGRPVAGRPFFGARPPAWQSLEDKVVIDELWDAIGVPRAPSAIVPLEEPALRKAARRLDQGAGTVWSGDATQGFHGGATYTVAVREPSDVPRALARLQLRCRTARVMPFLQGVPCSIHGIVLPDHVIVLRPAEMLVLRRQEGFVYGRAATFWDPPAADREAMREQARRVGEALRASHGYRGAFTMDGVLTAEGFRPTELNPRVGAALGLMHPDVPFDLLNAALVESEPLALAGAALEAALLAHADAHRQGSIMFMLDLPITGSRSVPLAWRDGTWIEVASDDGADGHVRIGPGATGGYASLKLDPATTSVGPSMAPRAAAFAAWLDETLGAGLGPLTPSTPVR